MSYAGRSSFSRNGELRFEISYVSPGWPRRILVERCYCIRTRCIQAASAQIRQAYLVTGGRRGRAKLFPAVFSRGKSVPFIFAEEIDRLGAIHTTLESLNAFPMGRHAAKLC